MSTTYSTTREHRDSSLPGVPTSSLVARLARTLGLGALVASAGLLAGLGVLRATSVFRLVPQDDPQIWVKSGCGSAEAAVRAALHATPEEPVFLVPLDQHSASMQNACRSTLATLDHEGYWWLEYFPEPWLCQRFADEASEHHGEPIPVPRFYADGRIVSDGIGDDVFARLGRPELQQHVTFFGSSTTEQSVEGAGDPPSS
jgi:hypothetical protein